MNTMTELKDVSVAHLSKKQTELQTEAEDAEEVLKSIDDMAIANQEDLDFVGEILTEVKGKKKALENERKKVTGPLNQALEVIRGWFRPPIRFYDRCEEKLKRKIANYHNEQRKKQQAALKAAGEASMKGDRAKAAKAMRVATAAKVSKVSGVSMRPVLKWKVEDFEKVPRAFLCVDHAAVNEYFKENPNGKISGITVEQDLSVSARAR